MKYFAINLEKTLDYHSSGKSINKAPMKHCRRASYNYEIIMQDIAYYFGIDRKTVKTRIEAYRLDRGKFRTRKHTNKI